MDLELLSSELSTYYESPNQLEIDSRTITDLVLDLTNPFAGIIDLKEKVGLYLFVKTTKGLSKEQKFNLSQETTCKIVEAIEQTNQAFSGDMFALKLKPLKMVKNMT